MSYQSVIQALKSTVKLRDAGGKFSSSGGSHIEGYAKENETEEERARMAKKLKLRAEQNKRRQALNRKQRERRDASEAKI